MNLLTANILSFENLNRITPPQNMQGGRHDFEHGLASVEQATPQAAWLTVRDHRNGDPYRVTIWLHSGQIALSSSRRVDSFPKGRPGHRGPAADLEGSA